MMTCNVVSPQLFWITSVRRSVMWTFVLSVVVNIGMWFERFVIIMTSLHRDYVPSSWVNFSPTIFDISDYVFSFGFFFTAFLLFSKYLPVVNMAEVKAVLRSVSEKPVKSSASVSQTSTKPSFNKDAE
jgi:hypothetical protein